MNQQGKTEPQSKRGKKKKKKKKSLGYGGRSLGRDGTEAGARFRVGWDLGGWGMTFECGEGPRRGDVQVWCGASA